MSKEELKKVGTEVSKECLKKLKILAIQKEITLQECLRNILEKSMSSKKMESVEENI